MSRRERVNQMGDQSKKFTNVFVKNFGDHLDTQKLKEMFECYGKILSCKVVYVIFLVYGSDFILLYFRVDRG